MKIRQSLVLIVIGILIGAVAAYFFLGQWGPSSITSKSATPFHEVTAQLDEGGELYGYLSTDGLVRMATTLTDRIQGVIENRASDAAEKERILSWLHLARKLVRDTGLYRVRALGISSRKITQDLNRTRMVLHRDPVTTNDLIWNLYAPTPRPLDELKMLPADTVLAQFGDFRPRVFWDWLQQQGKDSNVPEFKKGVAMLDPMLKMKGVDLDEILKGLNGSAGMIVTMDRERTLPLPMGKEPMLIPAPGLAIVISVKNHDLFQFISSRMPGDKPAPDGEIRQLTIPAPPNPIFSSPTLACNGKYLVFATENALALQILSADHASGLTAESDFIEMASGLPEKGNGFRFLSPRVGKVIRDIQSRALNNPELKEADRQSMKAFIDILPTDFSFYGVLEQTKTGFRYTLNHRLGAHNMMLMPLMAMGGVAVAVAIPNILTAVQKNRGRSTLTTMKHLSMEISARIAETGAAPAEIEKVADGWGNPILYRKGPGVTDFALASAGKDGRFSGWEQQGTYAPKGPDSFDQDMIMVNGVLVFGPLLK